MKQLSDEKLEQREKLFAWFSIPQRKRGCIAEVKIKELGISTRQYHIWKRDYEVAAEALHVRREVEARAKIEQEFAVGRLKEEDQKNTGRWTIGDIVDEDDPVGWWQRRTLELNQAILTSAKKGNAQSQKLAKQLAGELIEKSEVKVGLTADEIANRNFEAERRSKKLRKELGYRVEDLPK